MKQIKLSFFLTLLMSMVGMQAFADWDTSTKVNVGTFYYYLDTSNNQAQVTSMPSGYYTGDIEIPSSFMYNSTNYDVTSIGDNAFRDCSNLTSVTIPNSVTGISSYAFYQCSRLTSVTIPNSVTYIGYAAFYQCSGLESVTIPNGITSIEPQVFNGCSGLTSVTIPNSVTSIGYSAFYQCTGLTKVIVSNFDIATWCGIEFDSGNNPLFYAQHLYSDENTEITELVIPDGVTSIGRNAFQNCSGLESVTIPNSVTSIGNYAFQSCSGLESVTIPNSVTSIGQYAFRNCSGLESVTIPNSVTSIGVSAFGMCSGLTSLKVESGNTKYDSRNNCNAIIETASNTLIAGCKNTIIPNSVTIIGEAAFARNTGLTSITIPNSVTSIGNYAFWGCSSLESVTIPNSVTSIGSQAFYECTGLTSVTIGNSVTSIGQYAFQNCSGLTSVTLNSNAIASNSYSNSSNLKDIFGEQVTEYIIGEDVTSIGQSAFYDCTGLISVTIGNSVMSIGNQAFRNCSGLTSVTIGNSVTSIGYSAFYGCTGLTKVIVSNIAAWCGIEFDNGNNPLYYAHHLYSDENTEITDLVIPDSVTSIGNYAFWGCSSLESVTIPNSVTSIGNYAFWGCSSLESVTIPNSVTSIGGSAFSGCSGLESVTIPNSVTSIGGSAFSGCSGLTSIIIPSSVTNIGQYAFRNCSGLESVTIPNSVTSIGNNAFEGCSGLTSVTIPNSVTSIGTWAFSSCSGLTSVTVDINTPLTISNYTFTNRGNATLYVPAGCKSAYEAADYWKEFKEIVEMIDPANIILFADANVETICVEHWDTDGDGDLSYGEAAAVTTLSDYFSNNTSITSFDELAYFTGLTSISAEAFSGCTGLTSVTIPNSVTGIGNYAFSSCSGLTSVTIPNSVTSIGGSAFSGCSGLTSMIVESGNTKYDSRNNCNAIIETASNTLISGCKNTVIPNSVTSIGDNAFESCSNLTSIIIPNSVTSIGSHAFAYCSGLTSVTIPNSVTSIGYEAFCCCSNLGSVTIPNSETSIGNYAFLGCFALTSVTIPNSVTSIGLGAFGSCYDLSSMKVESGNTKYDSRDNCNAIIETASNTLISGCKNTVIPNSVTSIGEDAFGGCSGLTSVTIPNSVTSIGIQAFEVCTGLTSVTIPNSVTSIGGGAFYNCSSLTSVTVDINTPLTIMGDTFTNRANATLYVPAGCKSAYEAADYWKEFKEIVEPPTSVTIAMKTGSGDSRSMIAYSSRYGLDFSDRPELKAFIAIGYNWKKEVLLVHVNVVPPYTGMVIKTSNGIYDGGEYDVPTTTEDYYYSNLLVPVVETGTVTPTETIDNVEYTNLTIGTLTGGGIGFVRLTSDWTTHNKSYLRVPSSLYNNIASARELGGLGVEFVEGEEATAILTVRRNAQENEGNYYDLQGRKVNPVSKGLYIHNGKKVFVK